MISIAFIRSVLIGLRLLNCRKPLLVSLCFDQADTFVICLTFLKSRGSKALFFKVALLFLLRFLLSLHRARIALAHHHSFLCVGTVLALGSSDVFEVRVPDDHEEKEPEESNDAAGDQEGVVVAHRLGHVKEDADREDLAEHEANTVDGNGFSSRVPLGLLLGSSWGSLGFISGCSWLPLGHLRPPRHIRRLA